MIGHIVAEYEDYSMWEAPFSEAYPFLIDRQQYFVARSFIIPVSTYEDALLEPEWEIFQ